ncbi:hypothetical protein [Colwellia sp. Bg11-28]|uniref:hypothetical protein n=1 Tax=Colwellia sp. Bg11-28 TaxID=2058305 RepID=UPI000C32ADF8|nr:hypothetical protein [Colwellia sp. Bg11-28]PKH88263.1 hypothetical protein CXF79_05735 [Colwellia sp. Bg11-28]
MQEFKSYLEIAYFISGIIVAIAAIAALYQIKVAKDTLKIQSQREALSLTANQCQYYSDKIIKLSNCVYDRREKLNCDYFEPENWKVDTDGLDIKLECKIEKPVNLEVWAQASELLNALDGFAIFFVSGIADESVAYKAISSSYISISERYMSLAIKAKEHDGYYAAHLELYVLWKNRKKQEQLKLKVSDLNKEINKNVVNKKNVIGV